MAPYEPDSEFYRWGISIFTPSHNLLFPGGTTELDSSYGNYYFREDVSGSGNKDEYLQGSIFPQYTFGACTRDYSVVIEDGQEERNDSEPSSFNVLSLGTPVEFSVEDGKLERRLNHMVALPHVPRINGEIPSADDATSDHQRLLDRLKLYELVECKVQGDGNCQFRSLSDQLYRTPEHHVFVRQQVVEQLRSHRQNYEGYVPMAYSDYLNKLSKTGEWGDHVTLQAAADSYGIKIFVITSFKDTCYIEILPSVEKSKRVIFLSFWAEVHYNSIYPEEDLPAAADTKEKKKWWQFGK